MLDPAFRMSYSFLAVAFVLQYCKGQELGQRVHRAGPQQKELSVVQYEKKQHEHDYLKRFAFFDIQMFKTEIAMVAHH